jgi:small-conductance mechanosensitive channel
MFLMQPLYRQLQEMWVGFLELLPMLGIAALVLALTWMGVAVTQKIIRAPLRRARLRQSLVELILTLVKVLGWIVGVLIAITIVFPSLTPARLVTALGLGSVAVGLAFKDIFENFFAGILIMLREPMRIGDFIVCEGVEGEIEHIAIRETHIRQTDDQLVLVPNSFLFKNPLHIRTDKDLRRFEIIVGIAYSEPIDKAREVILGALQSSELVEQDRPREAYAREFNSSSIDFTVRWWARSRPIDMHQSRDRVVTTIKRSLDEAGIEIPFPYRTLTFKEPLTVNGQGSGPQ